MLKALTYDDALQNPIAGVHELVRLAAGTKVLRWKRQVRLLHNSVHVPAPVGMRGPFDMETLWKRSGSE